MLGEGRVDEACDGKALQSLVDGERRGQEERRDETVAGGKAPEGEQRDDRHQGYPGER
ncbi:hypothetical protein D9M68_395300 [compost metagenome]